MNQENDVETLSTHSETNSFVSSTASSSTATINGSRKSFIPQPKASLSSFAVPTWNNGVVGEHNSNIRVVARIRPSLSSFDGTSLEDKKVLFAIRNNDELNCRNSNDVVYLENRDASFTTLPSSLSNVMKSPPPGSSKSENVADIAARFNETPSSPLVPASLPSIITTPTKFIKSNHNSSNNSVNSSRRESYLSPPPSRKWNQEVPTTSDHTPIRTNGGIISSNNSNSRGSGLIPPSTMRQSFIQKPGCVSNCNDTSNDNCNSLMKKNNDDKHQIAAGLTDPKYFDFDAVSFH